MRTRARAGALTRLRGATPRSSRSQSRHPASCGSWSVPAPATLEAALTAEAQLRSAQEDAEARLHVADSAAGHEESRVVGLREKIASLRREMDNAAADAGHAKARLAELPAASTDSELAQ